MAPRKNIEGLLLGTAIGDALGLPYEELSPSRAAKLFKPPIRHRLVLGYGMCSDDTEHACMTAQAILASRGDVDRFRRSLAWRLRGWLLGMPAGIGLATLKSIIKLWLRFPPTRSGVWSAGNGPAMRAPILGVCIGDQPELLENYIRASTLITHRDPRALNGALLIARAAWLAATDARMSDQLLDELSTTCDPSDAELRAMLRSLKNHLNIHSSVRDFAHSLGVTGYIYHTVPVALYAWLLHRKNFRSAIEDVVSLGGDTDTVAATTGALCGAEAGADAIPAEWLDRIIESPRSIRWLRALATCLASPHPKPLPLAWWILPFRNLLFATVVLAHGFRRLLPPY